MEFILERPLGRARGIKDLLIFWFLTFRSESIIRQAQVGSILILNRIIIYECNLVYSIDI